MSGVFLCCTANSTMFTTCCSCAILPNEQQCPKCKEYIYPYYDKSDAKRSDYVVEDLRWKYAHKK